MSYSSIFRAVANNFSETLHGRLPSNFWIRLATDVFFFLPTVLFAGKMHRFELDAGKLGFPKAASRMLVQIYAGTDYWGPLPNGPSARLILSNHPGAGDTLSLLSQLNRDDIRIVAFRNAFIKPFKNLQKSLILIDPTGGNRSEAFQEILQSLREGKWVVLYPAGKIEPDPYWYPELKLPFLPWFRSVGTLVRLAQQQSWDFEIQTAVISRINSRRSLYNFAFSTLSDRSLKEKLSILHMLFLASARRWKTRVNFSRIRKASEFFYDPNSEKTKTYEQRVTDQLRNEAWFEVRSKI